MTHEEAKQLKKGDKILVEARVLSVCNDGDVRFSIPYHSPEGNLCITGNYAMPECVSRMHEKPKHDPCRRFKKGDKVEYTPRNGRDFFDMPWVYDAAVVIEDEDRIGSVVVRFTFNYGKPSVHKVPWYYLQIVTPVEELEPYYVKDDGTHYVVGKRPIEPEIVYLAEFAKHVHPHAKEAAEAECDRLNAEYRKEIK